MIKTLPVTSLKEYLFSEKHPDNDFSDVGENLEALPWSIKYPVLLFPYELERFVTNFNHNWEKVYLHLQAQTYYSSSPNQMQIEEVKKGRFEIEFASNLAEFLNLKPFADVSLGPYSPDIAIHVEEFDLWIDIEIDEPYTLKPELGHIHYKGNDMERDLFFLDKNWIVLRFNERQIAEFSQCCFKHIYHLLKLVANYTNNQTESRLSDIPLGNIFSMENKKWTKDEAWRMILNQTREKYRTNIDYINNVPKQKKLKRDFAEKMKIFNLNANEHHQFTILEMFNINILEISAQYVKFAISYLPKPVIVTKALYDSYLSSIREIKFQEDYLELSFKKEYYLYSEIEKFPSVMVSLVTSLRPESEKNDGDRLSHKAYWFARSKEIND